MKIDKKILAFLVSVFIMVNLLPSASAAGPKSNQFVVICNYSHYWYGNYYYLEVANSPKKTFQVDYVVTFDTASPDYVSGDSSIQSYPVSSGLIRTDAIPQVATATALWYQGKKVQGSAISTVCNLLPY